MRTSYSKAAFKVALKASARDIISDLTHSPELRLQAGLAFSQERAAQPRGGDRRSRV